MNYFVKVVLVSFMVCEFSALQSKGDNSNQGKKGDRFATRSVTPSPVPSVSPAPSLLSPASTMNRSMETPSPLPRAVAFPCTSPVAPHMQGYVSDACSDVSPSSQREHGVWENAAQNNSDGTRFQRIIFRAFCSTAPVASSPEVIGDCHVLNYLARCRSQRADGSLVLPDVAVDALVAFMNTRKRNNSQVDMVTIWSDYAQAVHIESHSTAQVVARIVEQRP